jgi:hypothetical protein
MKIMVRAALAAWSIASIGSAHADGDVPHNTVLPEIPGVTAQAPTPNAPDVAKLLALRAKLVDIVDADVVAALTDPS